jgi:uncharacterized membrane protein YdjX (TVP38/TMEM64 family)
MPEQFPGASPPASSELSRARRPEGRGDATTPPSQVPRTYTSAVDDSVGELSRCDGASPGASVIDSSLRSPRRGTQWVPAILRDRRVLATVAALAILAVAAALVPRPSISVVRDWAESMGPSFVVVFFLTQAVLTIAPVPRTVFTLSAGLLFGPAAGLTVTIAATTVSAVLALLLVRALGRTAVQARLTHPAVKAIDARLARRGWLAVGSLRLIAPAPFALVNYCSGLSAVRLLPYTAATVVGILPGTIAAVLFGDALTGQTNPALIVVTSVCVAAGVAGLLADARLPVSPAQIT